MRNEIREIRDSLVTSRHVTEGLRGLVVNLSDQVSSGSLPQIIQDENLIIRDGLNIDASRRECEIEKG